MARQHALWSASATERNLHCAGAITLGQHVEPAPESQAAAWGTAMHAVIEWALRDGGDPAEQIGTVIKTDEHAITVDEEMADTARVSIDHCRVADQARGHDSGSRTRSTWRRSARRSRPAASSISPPGIPSALFSTSSTTRAAVATWSRRPTTSQTRSYGLGWLCKHQDLHVAWVRLTIVQPRIPNPEGLIRSEMLHVTELVDWARELKAGHRQGAAAMLAWEQVEIGDEAALDAWATTWLRTGHCTFCPAAGQCPALRREAQALVNRYFEAEPDRRLDENMPDAVERDLERMELVEQWIRQRRAYAHRLAEGGTEFRNFMLVDRHGHRRWNESDEERVSAEIAQAAGVDPELLFNRKLKSPAQVEKLIGRRKQSIADLARADHRSRSRPASGARCARAGNPRR